MDIIISLKKFCIKALDAREDLKIKSAYQVGAVHLKNILMLELFKDLKEKKFIFNNFRELKGTQASITT